ncbi:MAG TPA: tetratricopeptide repeat protein [Candidatus Saccharimonadales bacterium]|jgi:Flp pilus assembly protein TadD|nr:tetratricopeptide repeat protein [Candidatus Saccharimonadales bacterium]
MYMKDRLRIGLLLGAVALIYGNILPNQFVLDDELYIPRNAQVVEPSLRALFTPNIVSMVFRPVTFATLALNWAISGPHPLVYHLFNLIFHAATVLLLYILLQELLGDSLEAKNIAFVAALLYAVHPIHTEAVAWAVGRAEVLAAGFLFAAWILHLKDRPIASLACFAMALLSKESAVAFLPMVILGDFAIGKWKPRIQYALIGGVTAAYLGLLWKVQGGRFGQMEISMVDNPLASVSGGWRILNALRVAWKYVALQFYPAMLSCDYSFNQIPIYKDWRHTLPAAIAAAAVVAVWVWAFKKRHVGVALAGSIYFAGFATTANILVPTGTIMGERLAYLPSAGLCLLAALGWNWLKQKKSNAAWGILVAIVLIFSVRTALRNRDWKDALALYSSSARAVPNSTKIHANLANAYLLSNQLDLADAEFQTALRIDPNSPETLSNYSNLEVRRGKYQDALDKMRKAMSMSGRDHLDYDSMVVTYAALLMKTNHTGEALENLNREISQAPQYSPAWSARAILHLGQGELKDARSDAQTALQIDRTNIMAVRVLQSLARPVSPESKN